LSRRTPTIFHRKEEEIATGADKKAVSQTERRKVLALEKAVRLRYSPFEVTKMLEYVEYVRTGEGMVAREHHSDGSVNDIHMSDIVNYILNGN
jgi:hypothetical protein